MSGFRFPGTAGLLERDTNAGMRFVVHHSATQPTGLLGYADGGSGGVVWWLPVQG